MSALALRLGLNRTAIVGLAGPILIVLILGMMVLPLPPLLLDLLFTFNIALAMIVLLSAMYTLRPLDFAVFPTVLLLTTLLRLSLNVASTRVVLMHGHTGPDAAGKVIEAFGQFLVGGNFAVGLVVFAILVVINFVVITKGAGRIAEVGARFTLDAMPGKQMAIDADLNAGLIGEDEARRRRLEIAEEADFYGAMDGASKFVRGDAIAGILILFINILGGLAIGIFQHDLTLAAATNNYVLLAIGDGLVAQIPALIISTAAGLVVSRVGKGEHTGQQILTQMFRQPHALIIAATVLGVLGLVPGMPHFSFLLLAGLLGFGARTLLKRAAQEAATPVPVPAPARDALEVSWDDLVPVDVLGLEVGYRLIPLVDKGQDGELLRRIKAIRKKFAQEVGFLPPAVHIRDNLELAPSAYRITLKGVAAGEGECHVGQFLAINPGRAAGALQGVVTTDPAFGLPAQWIDAAQRDYAQSLGYTVVDAGTVVATHLSTVVHAQASALLGRQEVQALLDQANKATPKLVDEVTPKLLPLSSVQRVLQNLLDEGVHIRDLRTVLETLADHAGRMQDPNELTAAVRVALGRAIVQQLYGTGGEISVIALDPELERVLQQVMGLAGPEAAGIEPDLAENLAREVAATVTQQEALGQPAVLLVPDRLRLPLARLLRRGVPGVRVLGHSEIPDARTIRVSVMVGGKR
ncbi:MAG: flagellar biosynthesis protein FlhA [Betaproteobacteria bacterium]|nr:flagellar biosynthesis protein FlhA [Betaproteobacteria bacterium]MBK6602839.1 flagellar biosynthesis protein FlhA [Betaproteobacteria bacterium]MBK7590170.1 flagellar biosynthesis protein FlhA [Betaproteobacteria bacterium]MBL0290194.1 flagellar biosynthesis protein FlhA [Betaproteobacteria bacterium]